MALAIGRPADRHLRIPERAISGILAPLSVAIEILIAGHLRRDILRGALLRRGAGILIGPLLVLDEADEIVGLSLSLIDLGRILAGDV